MTSEPTLAAAATAGDGTASVSGETSSGVVHMGEQRLHGEKRPRPEGRRGSGGHREGARRGRQRRGRKAPVRAVPASPRCSQCDGESPKYKCPKCRVAYCSVSCCRDHKEKGCMDLKESVASAKSIPSQERSKYLLPSDLLLRDPLQNSIQRRRDLLDEDADDELDEGWKITKEMMDIMDKSDWLKRELQDGGLRHIVSNIAAASNRVTQSGKTGQEEALEQAKSRYPPFELFVDKLLTLTGVLERQDKDDSMEDWLQLDREDLGSLALRAIPRKVRPALPPELADSDSQASTETSSSDSSSEIEETSSDSNDSSGDES